MGSEGLAEVFLTMGTLKAWLQGNGIPEAVAKLAIHPAVDEWIIAGMGHGQPMAAEPYIVDLLEAEHCRIPVADYHERIERNPA